MSNNSEEEKRIKDEEGIDDFNNCTINTYHDFSLCEALTCLTDLASFEALLKKVVKSERGSGGRFREAGVPDLKFTL